MITVDQIRELPRKYAIGKRPLSRVLGWGELTYTRLLDGSMPTPQHEAELLRALNEPLAYIMLLDQAYSNGVITESSYRKSHLAAEQYLQEDSSAAGALKMHAVAKRLCVLAKGDITPHAVHLLSYFVHGYSLVTLKEPLFDQQPFANEDGPWYEALSAWFTFDRIQEIAANDDQGSELKKAELNLIGAVFDRYGCYSGTKLTEIACSESPWRKARKRSAESGGQAVPITAKSMVKHFAKLVK